MEGHKLALGLILVLIASGCAEMTGDASNSSSFDSLGLTVEEVENVTNSEYKASESVNSSSVYTVNISNVVRRVDSMFLKEENLSEAPDSVRSMVVALNGSEPGSLEKGENISSVTVDGYEAQRIEEANRTTLYGQEGNISFFVQSEGDGGIYRSTRELYRKMAEEIEKFEE
jgi:hypothetical protein